MKPNSKELHQTNSVHDNDHNQGHHALNVGHIVFNESPQKESKAKHSIKPHQRELNKNEIFSLFGKLLDLLCYDTKYEMFRAAMSTQYFDDIQQGHTYGINADPTYFRTLLSSQNIHRHEAGHILSNYFKLKIPEISNEVKRDFIPHNASNDDYLIDVLQHENADPVIVQTLVNQRYEVKDKSQAPPPMLDGIGAVSVQQNDGIVVCLFYVCNSGSFQNTFSFQLKIMNIDIEGNRNVFKEEKKEENEDVAIKVCSFYIFSNSAPFKVMLININIFCL